MTKTTSDPSTDHIAQLLERARHAAGSGDLAGAIRGWEQVLRLSPGHADTLVQLGQAHLARGDADRAEQFLGQAVAIQPNLALAHAYLARVHQKKGDQAAALASLDRALENEPTAWGASFEKAKLLEALGRHREAALAWSTGVQYMPPGAAQSPQLQPLFKQANEAIAANQERLREHIDAATADLMAGERDRHVARFRHCRDILTGRRQLIQARPLMLAMPELPSIQFFHREDFSWAPLVEAATDEIRAEMEAATADDPEGVVPYVQTGPGAAKGQFAALDRNRDWGAYFLWRHGQRLDDHCARCPRTLEAVQQAPMVHIRSRAPAVLFSVLQPGAHIPPHNGPTNTRLTVHLPLVVPEGCAFRVGDDTRPWTPGELFIFDDTIRHEAWNRGTSRRVILIFDVWHPMLSELERKLVTATVEAMVDYYDSSAELGEL